MRWGRSTHGRMEAKERSRWDMEEHGEVGEEIG